MTTPRRYDRAFGIGVALNVAFVVIEAVYGLATDSLALLADAGHNLGDVFGLLLAWGAVLVARRAPSGRFTYGFRRATILAALTSGLLLLIAVGALTVEAIGRFGNGHAVPGTTLIVVAAIGVVVNTATALLFFADRARDLNLRGAFLHMAADAAVSLAVVVGGVAIQWTGAAWIDPALGLLIAVVVLVGTLGLLRDALGLSLDAVPREIEIHHVDQWLRSRPGVCSVHDLHVWALSTTETALTAHLVMPEGADDRFLHRIAHELEQRFGIHHCTIQVEHDAAPGLCKLDSPNVV
jgi:cobalt-zinc-cadmium efflux system protein